ncbi:Flp pilus assembly protein CpaB [Anaerocolumna chitinilytica]|uniref:Flp pilus assembly protein CpaB n=1 Tax=Anaerocolumna chitinilytica TaxID=1727145 RepID=A0A7I8DIY9_9FIRM|nr:Flp pilus assembly protein CpaB [Anaerocolumna chitinilytica]BCJ98399.1 Flp pilus assembly protein CpaB [Anaerocolumna chitinilytica]
MKYLKNKTVIGIIAIVVGLLLCFIVSPLYNRASEAKTKVVRVEKFIEKGSLISKSDVKVVEVGSYNMQDDVLHTEKDVVGKYAVDNMYQDENILKTKLSDEPLSGMEYLEGMNGTYGAISITLQSFAAGLSGKLLPGDIVSVISTSDTTQDTNIMPELQYVRVLASTTQKGKDIKESDSKKNNDDEDNLPLTVTLQVTRKQALALAQIEQLEKAHLELVFRGTNQEANVFLEQQKKIIEEQLQNDSSSNSDTAIQYNNSAEVNTNTEQNVSGKQNAEEKSTTETGQNTIGAGDKNE